MFAVVPELVRPPPLAAGLSTFHADAPFERAMLLDGPAPPAPPPPSRDAGRFVRHHRLGKTGLYVTIAGLGVTVGGVTWVFTDGLTCVNDSVHPCSLVSPVLTVFAGGLVIETGSVLMFVGELEAAHDGRRAGLQVSPTLGWIGVGLLAGADALTVTVVWAGYNTSPVVTGLQVGLGIGGLVCGAVELGKEGRAGRAKGLVARMVPTPDGLVVAGAF